MNKILNHLKSDWYKYTIELVVITAGILGAYALNNWNEGRKNKQLELDIYENLYSSLKTDSVKLIRILGHINASIEAQETVIQNDYYYVMECCDPEQVLADLYDGSFSFFPKYGAYNQIVSDGQLPIIRNEEIRDKLTELYDYQFTRYANIDAIVDHKFQYEYDAVAAGKMEFVYYEFTEDSLTVVSNLNAEKFKSFYGELQAATRSLYIMTTDVKMQLLNIQTSINELLELLKQEMER